MRLAACPRSPSSPSLGRAGPHKLRRSLPVKLRSEGTPLSSKLYWLEFGSPCKRESKGNEIFLPSIFEKKHQKEKETPRASSMRSRASVCIPLPLTDKARLVGSDNLRACSHLVSRWFASTNPKCLSQMAWCCPRGACASLSAQRLPRFL